MAAGFAAIAAVVLLAAGCGNGAPVTAADHPDASNGQTLFSSKCGACHTMQAAGTNGTIGPNLDNSFAGPRKEGFDDSSIANVVLDQIRIGTVTPILAPYNTSADFTSAKCLDPATKQTCYGPTMDANIVTGQDAIDVAAYVGSVAGIGGFTNPVNLASLTDGADIFKQGPCASCHTLKDAGSTGTSGPNLDQLASALTKARIIRQVANGGASMPAFGTQLTKAQIAAVAKYVLSVAGK